MGRMTLSGGVLAAHHRRMADNSTQRAASGPGRVAAASVVAAAGSAAVLAVAAAGGGAVPELALAGTTVAAVVAIGRVRPQRQAPWLSPVQNTTGTPRVNAPRAAELVRQTSSHSDAA